MEMGLYGFEGVCVVYSDLDIGENLVGIFGEDLEHRGSLADSFAVFRSLVVGDGGNC